MPRVIEISLQIGIGEAIEVLALLIGVRDPADFENQVRYVPIR